MNNNMNVFTPPKTKQSWRSKIVELHEGEDFNALYMYRTTIAPIITSVKKEFKHRNYETCKITSTVRNKKVEYLNIKRLEDINEASSID
jgi:hypothetical protein